MWDEMISIVSCDNSFMVIISYVGDEFLLSPGITHVYPEPFFKNVVFIFCWEPIVPVPIV